MKQRKWARIAGFLIAIALVSAACGDGSSHEPAEGESNRTVVAVGDLGDPVPADSFQTFSGETATLSDYAGRPLVVNFWASWCPSCVAEMSAAFLPAQLRLADEVAFLGLNIQDERQKALELVEETGVLFDLAEDTNGALYRALGGLGMPFTVFVSSEGRVVDVHNGPLTESQLVDRIVEVLLS